MKKILPVLFFLIFAAAIAEGFYIWHPEWFSFLNQSGSQPTPTTNEEQTPAPPKVIKESTTYYDIDAEIPSGTPLSKSAGASSDTRVVATLEAFATGEITRFKDNENFAHLTAEAAALEGYSADRKKVLTINYKEYIGAKTVSYVFTMYQDTFGAHGNTFFRTFTFDLDTGAGVVLPELFRPDAPYLDTLSTLARGKLSQTLGAEADKEMIANGTTAYDDNFQNFYVDGETLVLVFPPYQVAAYASGVQSVRIPFSELSTMLR